MIRRSLARCLVRPTGLAAILMLLFVLEALLLARPASAQLIANGTSLSVTTSNATATFAGLDLTGFVNTLTGESYLTYPSAGELASVNTINVVGQALQASDWTIAPEAGTGIPVATITTHDTIRSLTMTVKIDPVSQEIVLRSSATASSGGLRFGSWSIAGLNLDAGRLIIPADTGVVFDRAHPGLNTYIQYPNSWHAQMAVFEGLRGSFVLYSTDQQMLFKDLSTTTRGRSTIDVALAGEAVAPFPSATVAPPIEWRLKAFSGDWRVAAEVYRTWMLTNRPPVSKAAYPWVSNIRTVLWCPSDPAFLQPLAAIVNPSQTLLYVYGRRDPFDVNYPDYTPQSGEASFISAAHALGFKVMLHVNLIGVSPFNPSYPSLQPQQVKNPETLAPVGWMWHLAPETTTRFAYINPGSAAYRSLLVSKLQAGLAGLGADALHLDQSGQALNDGNGPVEGLSYAQGVARLHEDLTAAFPGLALGGEAENDITYRYHAFVQAWWLPDAPPQGHPIAAFLFSPHVRYYGHLIQPSARSGAFGSYLLKLEQRAISPMIKADELQDLDPSNADNARLFGIVQSWQNHAFVPAWTADWSAAIARYQGLAGSTAAFTDSGTVATLTAAGSTLVQIAHDASQIASGSFVANWPAFDNTTVYGLDSSIRYFLDPVPRPASTHVTSLPAGTRLGPETIVGPGFATIEVLPPDPPPFDSETALVGATTGVAFGGTDFPLTNGAIVSPRQSFVAGGVTRVGLFMSPPYQAQLGGEAFAEFRPVIPPAGVLTFFVALADGANCSDGMTFRVTVGGAEIWREHVQRTGWHDVLLNLAVYAGTTTPIRLVTNPGPGAHPYCDWGNWSGVAVRSSLNGTIALPLALSTGSVVSGFDGTGTYSATGALTGTVTNVPVPGRFTLFTANGSLVANATNLATLPFQTLLWNHGELAQPGRRYGGGAVGPITIGGVTKSQAIAAFPANLGSTRYTWLVRLPHDTPLRLGWSAGILDGAFSQDGVEFIVRVNGAPYWRLTKQTPGWTPGSLDLSPWKGQNVVIDLLADSIDTATFDWGAWADLALTAGGTACSYSVPAGASIGQAGGAFSLNVTAAATCPWSAVSSAPGWLMPTSGSGSANGTVTYTVLPNIGPPRSATLTIAGQAFTVTQSGALPTMTLDKTSLQFGGWIDNVKGVPLVVATSPQVVRLTQSGAGTVTWTATSSQPWMVVSPLSGTGSATVSVSVGDFSSQPVTGTATITLAFSGTASSPGPITASLTMFPSPLATPGVIDTPLDNRTGVTGSVPFTGWALDSIEVVAVTICRAPVTGESAALDGRCGGASEIYLGNGTFIDGARPDVRAAYPTYPRSTRAGWGFMVLTNMLPNQGNGTYVFSAYAFGRPVAGLSLGGLPRVTLLGRRTMTCANASATLPFGAIDTPEQGGVTSGGAYVNFGWALTPQPKLIPLNGSTISVLIDGIPLGTVDYNHERADIEFLFPGFQNTAGTNGAIGFRVIDTTTLTNGVHTISWTVIDNQGAIEGIGSRFFTVSNGAGALTPAQTADARAAARATSVAPQTLRLAPRAQIETLPLERAPLVGRRGWDVAAPLRTFDAGPSGQTVIRSEEVSRVELQLGSGRHDGYLRTSDGVAPLPIGSRLDPETGVFTWAPGVGFVGAYDLVFVRHDGSKAVARQEVRIILQPKGSGSVGPQVVIDIPRSQQDVEQPFVLAGWAADLTAPDGTGIATLHAWAYPVAGGPPVFLGATAYGGARPDVAAAHGEQFKDSGFGLVVQGLPHGSYDLAVFAWSTEAADFVPARTVRVTVR